MIIKTVQDNILNTEAKHIAFAINSEGINDAGFAGIVSSNIWPELENCGQQEIGTVISKTLGDKTYHALVCHSLYKGWGDNQSEVIKQCFDTINSNGEPIASIAIGTGFVGQLSGANFNQIACGMNDSNQQIILYGQYDLDAIKIICEKEKVKSLSK